MYYLITYDIASPKRLYRVSMLCKNYGVRIQKSVFECHLDKPTFNTLWQKIQATIHRDEDTVTAYPICASCLKDVRQTTPRIHPTPPICYVI